MEVILSLEEKYNECKQLKDIIDQVRGLGIEIARLNKNKLNAVYIEDFDTAQELKIKVQNLRSQLDLIDYKNYKEIITKYEEQILTKSSSSTSSNRLFIK